MLPVSNAYRKMVYNKAPYDMQMRQFIPYASIKIVDLSAVGQGNYSATTAAFYNDYSQLEDDITDRTFGWGTMEPFQFILNGTQMLMPDDPTGMKEEQNGWVSETLSDSSGVFIPLISLTCIYDHPVTTIGRIFYFDPTYDSVPKDFNIIYSGAGVEVARDTVRNNSKHTYISEVKAQKYDKVVLEVLSTTLPHRRVHLLECVPGLLIEFQENEIVSISVSQELDILSDSLITGEAVLVIQNTIKLLDILNKEGLNAYLSKRQPIDLYLILVFPDGSTERVLLGHWELSSWESNNKELTASFTVNDPLAKLGRKNYYKGTFSEEPISLYALAEQVLQDAEVTDYSISESLKQFRTSWVPPVATHKEILRLIAQAGMCIVTTTANGGIQLRDVFALVSGTNLIQNALLDTSDNWTLSSTNLVSEETNTGTKSFKFTSTRSSVKQYVTTQAQHKYYVKVAIFNTIELTSLRNVILTFGTNTAGFRETNPPINKWVNLSGVWEAGATSQLFQVSSSAAANSVYVDSPLVVDLTAMFGVGNEPTKAWCDANLSFSATTLWSPPIDTIQPDDEIDYTIMFDPPDIVLADPISDVSVVIKSPQEDMETSELFKGSKTLKGTQTFWIEFTSPSKDYTVKITKSGTSTELTPKTINKYAYGAEITLQYNGIVNILATGKAMQTTSSTYTIVADESNEMEEGAESYTVDNPFITDYDWGVQLAEHSAYWKARRYEYSFEWAQNPALEVGDKIRVQDDFGNNNIILCTSKELDYAGGYLVGSSRGIV